MAATSSIIAGPTCGLWVDTVEDAPAIRGNRFGKGFYLLVTADGIVIFWCAVQTNVSWRRVENLCRPHERGIRCRPLPFSGIDHAVVSLMGKSLPAILQLRVVKELALRTFPVHFPFTANKMTPGEFEEFHGRGEPRHPAAAFLALAGGSRLFRNGVAYKWSHCSVYVSRAAHTFSQVDMRPWFATADTAVLVRARPERFTLVECQN